MLLAQDAGKTVADQEDLQSRFSSLSFLMIIMPVVNKLLSRILANIMDQLGDLGRHAVDIMDGIGLELCTYICTYCFIPEYKFVKCSRATLLLANKPSRLS